MAFLSRLVPFALVAWIVVFPASARVFDPETFTLDNGLQVVVVTNHRVPVVTQMIWYKVGAADEPEGKSGIAHFFEHLMFKGTKHLAPGEFSRTVARNGGKDNAFTASDYTAYYETVAKDRLPIVMRMEADRMTNLLLTSDQIEPERKVILEERRMRVDNDPASVLSEQVGAALFMNYPYRIPVIGWEHEIRGLTPADLEHFYRQWYVPNNAILVLAGDVTAAEVRPLVEKYFGVIPRGPEKERVRPQEPPQHAARSVVLRDEKVRQPNWSRYYLAPSFGTDDGKKPYALEVAADALGGSTGILYRELVVDTKRAVSAGAYYSPNGIGPARLVIYATPSPGVGVDALGRDVDALLKRVLDKGLGEDAIERAKTGMIAEAVYARDSLTAGARVLGAALATGRSIADVETWPDRIESVTKAEVDAALADVLNPDQSVTAQLLPKKTNTQEASR